MKNQMESYDTYLFLVALCKLLTSGQNLIAEPQTDPAVA